jgi:hypothetical protein
MSLYFSAMPSPAYDAADQLPTDLQSLAEARHAIVNHLRDVERDRTHIADARAEADELDASLRKSTEEATSIVARLDSAYSAATSQGLAAAFSERSRSLDRSMWTWVTGLIVALGLGAFFGSLQLHNLVDVLADPQAQPRAIAPNVVLSLLSITAPIWFGRLATKQIGQRFRLSEDYAFKAAVSRAYEGYRREAVRIDKDMEAQLLASALARLDDSRCVWLSQQATAAHGMN